MFVILFNINHKFNLETKKMAKTKSTGLDCSYAEKIQTPVNNDDDEETQVGIFFFNSIILFYFYYLNLYFSLQHLQQIVNQ